MGNDYGEVHGIKNQKWRDLKRWRKANIVMGKIVGVIVLNDNHCKCAAKKAERFATLLPDAAETCFAVGVEERNVNSKRVAGGI